MKNNNLIVFSACVAFSMMLLSGCGEGGADKTAAVIANAEADNRAEAVSGSGESETVPVETSVEETTPAVQKNAIRLDAEDIGQFKSAVEALEDSLEKKGVRLGFDAKRKAIVVVGSCECFVTNFHDVVDMIDESKRFEITEGAFLDALAKIAGIFRQEVGENGSMKTEDSDVFLNSNVALKLKGVRIFMQTESLSSKGKGGVYEVALAAAWSENLSQVAEAAMAGRLDELPRGFPVECSLEDWVQRNQSLVSMLGVRFLFDAPKHFWVLGIASQNDGESDGSSVSHARAAYAAECALGGNLKATQSIREVTSEGSQGELQVQRKERRSLDEECSIEMGVGHHRLWSKEQFGDSIMTREVEMKPFLHISPDASGIRWFEQRAIHPMTGRHVKVTIAAIPAENIGSFLRGGGAR